MKLNNNRRNVLKSIAIGAGSALAGKTLPESWSRLATDSVIPPAHAAAATIDVTLSFTISGIVDGVYGYAVVPDDNPPIGFKDGPITTDSINRTDSYTLVPGRYSLDAGSEATGVDGDAEGEIFVTFGDGSKQVLSSWTVANGQTSADGRCIFLSVDSDGTCQVEAVKQAQ